MHAYVCSLFPLLQLFDKHINMSIIGYFGVVHSLNCCQDQLPSSPTGSRQAVQKQEESQSECVSEKLSIHALVISVKNIDTYVIIVCMFV